MKKHISGQLQKKIKIKIRLNCTEWRNEGAKPEETKWIVSEKVETSKVLIYFRGAC